VQWDTSDDFFLSNNRAWYDAWLHRNLGLKDMEPQDAYTVALLLKTKLGNLGFIQEERVSVVKG
jgi:hypothetical protein